MTPRWLVEAVAWSLAVVLLGGVVASQAVEPERVQVVEEATPAYTEPARQPLRLTPPPAAPAPAPAPEPPVQNAAAPALDLSSVLGPPPGPQYDRPPARTAAPQDRYAFLVGVQDYRRPTVDTIGSVKDVQYIEARLVEAGWPRQNIRVVTNEAATGAAIRDGLAWLAANGRDGTFSLFHYSGHVKQHGSQSESLWPVDRDFVRDREVARMVSAIGGRVWVDVAGCEAGSFADGVPNDRVLFSGSSNAAQKSYEYPPWGMSRLDRPGVRPGHAPGAGRRRRRRPRHDGRGAAVQPVLRAGHHARPEAVRPADPAVRRRRRPGLDPDGPARVAQTPGL